MKLNIKGGGPDGLAAAFEDLCESLPDAVVARQHELISAIHDRLSAPPEVARIDLEDACKMICNYCRQGMPLLGFVHPFDMQSLPKEWQHDIGKTLDGKDDLRDECEAGALRALAARSPLRQKP